MTEKLTAHNLAGQVELSGHIQMIVELVEPDHIQMTAVSAVAGHIQMTAVSAVVGHIQMTAVTVVAGHIQMTAVSAVADHILLTVPSSGTSFGHTLLSLVVSYHIPGCYSDHVSVAGMPVHTLVFAVVYHNFVGQAVIGHILAAELVGIGHIQMMIAETGHIQMIAVGVCHIQMLPAGFGHIQMMTAVGVCHILDWNCAS
jgi:hypothetical protein